MYLSTPGIILRSSERKDYDRLLTVFTEKLGKIEVLSRGARRTTSKLSPHLQFFCIINFYLVQGRRHHQLLGAKVVRRFDIAELVKLSYGFYFLELIDELTRLAQSSNELFLLLTEGLNLLTQTEQLAEYKRLRVAFLLRLLKLTGFNPEKRVVRNPQLQTLLVDFLQQPLAQIKASQTNGYLKSLFNISQYGLNEVLEKPLTSVKFMQIIK